MIMKGTLVELLNMLKQHNIATFTLTGLGETTLETSYFSEVEAEVNKLKKQAEIGSYTEMAFKKGYEMLIDDLYFIKHIETLIEWGREQSEVDNE